MPKVLKRPRLSAGISESVEDMNQTRLEQGGIQDVISMHPHSSSEAPKEKELAHRRCDSGSDFDREKDQGQARAPGSEDSTEVLVTPRASVQSPEAAHEIETDQAGSLSDPPLHLKLLEACVGSFTMQNVRPYQEVCIKIGHIPCTHLTVIICSSTNRHLFNCPGPNSLHGLGKCHSHRIVRWTCRRYNFHLFAGVRIGSLGQRLLSHESESSSTVLA